MWRALMVRRTHAHSALISLDFVGSERANGAAVSVVTADT
jgi:hypothetical protein